MTFIYILIFIAIFMAVFALSKSIDTKETLQRDFATKEKLKEWAEMSCKIKDQFNDLKNSFDKTHLWGIKAYIQNTHLSYFDKEAKKGEVYEMKSTIVKDKFTFKKGDRVMISGDSHIVSFDQETKLTYLTNCNGREISVSSRSLQSLLVTQKDYEDRINEANYMLDKELEAIGDDNLIAELMDQNHVLIKENERLTKEIDRCSKMNAEQVKDMERLEYYIKNQKIQIKELCLQKGMMNQTRSAKKKKP